MPPALRDERCRALLHQVICRCLRRNPDERYGNVVELARQLAPLGTDSLQAARVAKVATASRARLIAAAGDEGLETAVTPLAVTRSEPDISTARSRPRPARALAASRCQPRRCRASLALVTWAARRGARGGLDNATLPAPPTEVASAAAPARDVAPAPAPAIDVALSVRARAGCRARAGSRRRASACAQRARGFDVEVAGGRGGSS